MASEGPNIAGSGADNSASGIRTWSNPTRVNADDGSRTSAPWSGNGGTTDSHLLQSSSHGHAIPDGATIDGVEVQQDIDGSGQGTTQQAIQLCIGGTPTGNDLDDDATWSTTAQTVTYGASDELWGLTPTAAEINASGFGFVTQERTANFSQAVGVDAMWTTVYYTEGGGGGPALEGIERHYPRGADRGILRGVA